MSKERPFLVSVDLGDVAGPALDKLCTYRKSDRSAIIRECVLVCYNFALLKRFEGAIRRAERERSPNVTKPSQKPASDEEKAVIQRWREVFNHEGNIYWPRELATIRKAVAAGVPHEDQMDIIELSANDSYIGQVLRRGEIPNVSLILSEGMLAKFVPMLDAVREDVVRNDSIRLEGVVKPRALKQLQEFLSDDAMSKVYDLITVAETEDQVNTIVREATQAQFDDYAGNLFKGSEGEWKEKATDGEN